MPEVAREDLVVGRVINETDDHYTVEFGKHEGASFSVAPLPGEEATPTFVTALFVKADDDGKAMHVWKPWEAEADA